MTSENTKALESATESSKRGRSIVLLIQLTCIVVFMAFWQERQSAWPVARLHAARAAVLVADCNAKSPDDASKCIQALDPSVLQSGKAVLAQWGFTPEQAKTWVSLLQSSMVNRVINTGVPVLGATLDVNDLGLLGGITFLTLLGWLRFSLWREQSNVQLLFSRCRGHGIPELIDGYELLAMAQVLSVPQMPLERRKRPLAWMPTVLLASPLLVEATVLVHDKLTYSFGHVMQAVVTDREFEAGLIILITMVWLTWECFKLSLLINREWKGAYEEINKHKAAIKKAGA